MKVGEIVKIHRSLLEMLAEHDIKMGDFKYVELYREFEEMARHEKVSYAVVSLSEKYNVSEASVYRILKRFRKAL